MNKVSEVRCDTCLYCERRIFEDAIRGRSCRYRAPILTGNGLWPLVSKCDWCGSWVDRETGESLKNIIMNMRFKLYHSESPIDSPRPCLGGDEGDDSKRIG